MNIDLKKNIVIFLFISILFSCASEVGNTFNMVPTAFGKSNEIKIVCDKNIWEGTVGDSLDFYYSSPFPILPSPEPIFDLKHFEPQLLENHKIFQHYRTIMIVANLNDKQSKTTQLVIKDIGEQQYQRALSDPSFRSIVGKNKWASGQIILYIFALSQDELVEVLKNSFDDITRRVYDHDYSQIVANTYSGGRELGIEKDFELLYKMHIDVPKNWKVAKVSQQDKCMWMRFTDRRGIQNIVAMQFPYRDESQFGKEYIISKIEDFGSKHIDGDILNVNDVDLPMYEYNLKRDGYYLKEYRGIWESENNFKGGPFIAQAIKNNQSKEVLLLFSFVYAPGQKKRNLVQSGQCIMHTARQLMEN